MVGMLAIFAGPGVFFHPGAFFPLAAVGLGIVAAETHSLPALVRQIWTRGEATRDTETNS